MNLFWRLAICTACMGIDKLNRDIVSVLKLPEVNERMIKSGFDPAPTTVAEFDEFVKVNFARNAKIIKEMGIRAE